MPKFRCSACQHEFDWEGKFAPFKCPVCLAKGKCAVIAGPAASAPAAPASPPAQPSAPATPTRAAFPKFQVKPTVPSSTDASCQSVSKLAEAAAQAIVPQPIAPIQVSEQAVEPEVWHDVEELGPESDLPLEFASESSTLFPPEAPEQESPALRPLDAPGPKPITPPEPPRAPLPPRRDPPQVAWRYPADSAFHGQPLRACPAVDADGRAYVAMGDKLLMFPAGASAPQWEYATGRPIFRSPAIGPDGNVRIHGCDGLLHLIDPCGKRVHDPVAVGEPLGWASPLVDQQNNTWICGSEGGLIKVDSRGKTSARPFLRTRRRFDSTGVIRGDILYVGCEDHFVNAISLGGGRGTNLWANSPNAGRTGCAINAPLALADGPELLVVSQDDHLHAFNLDGEERWNAALPGKVLGSPVVRENTAYVGVSLNPRNQPGRGMLVAVDRTTQRIRWQYEAAGPIESSPVIGDDGVVYFGDNAGVAHAVDPCGTCVWKVELGSAVRSAGTLLRAGLVAFGVDAGSVVALNCSSQDLCSEGWPKHLGTLGQCGLVALGTPPAPSGADC